MRKKRVYLVGIKGVAMTSLAVYLKERGDFVTGSDIEAEYQTDMILKKYHIEAKKGFSNQNIDKKYDEVIVTGAHGGMTNIEARQALQLKIPTYMHGKYLGMLMRDKFGISISGCHGKTTTSSLISFLLTKSGLNPSYLVGTAEINGLGPGGHFDKSRYLIAEADEYMTCPLTDKTPRFMWQKPKILVITNIEFDHPDAFANIREVKDAFFNFVDNLSDDTLVVACIDDENVRNLLLNIRQTKITYGFSPQADFQIERYHFDQGIGFMRVKSKQLDLGEYMLQIPGRHNLLNSLASLIVGQQVGVSRENIKNYLTQYTGCKRRFEKIGEAGNLLLYDDYAHHPTEVSSTIQAAKEWFKNRRIMVIFQPHTFSRTKALFQEFSKSFIQADYVLITDIFPSAREKEDKSINSHLLTIAINNNRKNAYYIKSKEEALSILNKKIESNDLIITMGAGDIYLWHEDLKNLLNNFYA